MGVMYQIFLGKKFILGSTFLERVDIFFQKNGWVLVFGGQGIELLLALSIFFEKKEKRIFLLKKNEVREYHFFGKKNVSVWELCTRFFLEKRLF